MRLAHENECASCSIANQPVRRGEQQGGHPDRVGSDLHVHLAVVLALGPSQKAMQIGIGVCRSDELRPLDISLRHRHPGQSAYEPTGTQRVPVTQGEANDDFVHKRAELLLGPGKQELDHPFGVRTEA